MWSNWVRLALVLFDVFVALRAGAGGILMLAGVEDARLPADLLRGTPFHSYRVPGAILAVVVGGTAAVATAFSFASIAMGASLSLAAGVVMIGWVIGEVIVLRAPQSRSWIEAGYFCVGATMAVLALVVMLAGTTV